MSRIAFVLVLSNVLMLLAVAGIARRAMPLPQPMAITVVPLGPLDGEEASRLVDLGPEFATPRSVARVLAKVLERELRIDDPYLGSGEVWLDAPLVAWRDGVDAATAFEVLSTRLRELDLDIAVDEPGVLEIAPRTALDERLAVRRLYDIRPIIAGLRDAAEPAPEGRRRSGTTVPDLAAALRRLALEGTLSRGDRELASAVEGLVCENVSPDDWVYYGGSAAHLVEIGGVLIIEAPPRMHREIAPLLSAIEASVSDRAIWPGLVIDGAAAGTGGVGP